MYKILFISLIIHLVILTIFISDWLAAGLDQSPEYVKLVYFEIHRSTEGNKRVINEYPYKSIVNEKWRNSGMMYGVCGREWDVCCSELGTM